MEKAQICPFKDACRDCIKCDKVGGYYHYEKCEEYARNLLYFDVAIPHICPLFDYEKNKCKYNDETCTREDAGLDVAINIAQDCSFDYRICTTFSAWFWKKRAKT